MNLEAAILCTTQLSRLMALMGVVMMMVVVGNVMIVVEGFMV